MKTTLGGIGFAVLVLVSVSVANLATEARTDKGLSMSISVRLDNAQPERGMSLSVDTGGKLRDSLSHEISDSSLEKIITKSQEEKVVFHVSAADAVTTKDLFIALKRIEQCSGKSDKKRVAVYIFRE